MATYYYKARDKFGKLISGLMGAETENAIVDKLNKMGFVTISIKEIKGQTRLNNFFSIFKRVRFSDLNMFTRQLATLQKAGVPLLSSLKAIKEQTVNRVFKDAIGQIIRDIEGGASLSQALDKHPNIFNALYINMISSGEAAGTLDQSLERLTTLGEHDEAIRLQLMTATRYPLIVVIAIIIGFLVLTTFVVPRFARIYSQFAVALPLPTRILIGLNYLITKFYGLLILAVSLFVLGFNKIINTKRGRFWWDNFKLKTPIFGPIILKLIMSRFARITGILMRSGVPILKVLDLASSGTGNAVISKNIGEIKKSVAEGKGISKPMQNLKVFTPVVIQMVSIGEETGKLDELLLHVSDYYDSELDYTIKNFASLIEPILILLLGCVVLFMALGIFLPMWNLVNIFKR